MSDHQLVINSKPATDVHRSTPYEFASTGDVGSVALTCGDTLIATYDQATASGTQLIGPIPAWFDRRQP